MKKFILFSIVTLGLVLAPSLVLAQGTQQQDRVQDPATHASNLPSPTGSQVKNQNQVSTQNMGEESNLMVSTSEQEGTASRSGLGLANKNAVAVEHMSIVAQKVQELLQVRTAGGIGDQVRTIAQEQNQIQDQIRLQLDKISAKGSLAKALFGPDYQALKSLEQQMEQNELKIEKLQELKLELVNAGDQTAVQETIDALIQENTSLEEILSLEGNVKSVFGWLVRLFAR